jgi:hypothetical protein
MLYQKFGEMNIGDEKINTFIYMLQNYGLDPNSDEGQTMIELAKTHAFNTLGITSVEEGG